MQTRLVCSVWVYSALWFRFVYIATVFHPIPPNTRDCMRKWPLNCSILNCRAQIWSQLIRYIIHFSHALHLRSRKQVLPLAKISSLSPGHQTCFWMISSHQGEMPRCLSCSSFSLEKYESKSSPVKSCNNKGKIRDANSMIMTHGHQFSLVLYRDKDIYNLKWTYMKFVKFKQRSWESTGCPAKAAQWCKIRMNSCVVWKKTVKCWLCDKDLGVLSSFTLVNHLYV